MPKKTKSSSVNRAGKIKEQTPDSKKTKDQLLRELQRLRRKNTKLQTDLKGLRSESTETKLFSELYYSVFEGINSGVVIHTPDTKIIYCNKAAEQMFRLSRDQIMGLKGIKPGWSFTGKTGKPLKESQFPVLRVLATGKPISNLTQGIKSPKRKNIVWLSVQAFPVFDKKGLISKVVVTSNDITKLKQAENKLKNAQKLLENKLAETELEFGNLFNLSMDLMCVSSMTHFLKINPSVKKILGYTKEEIYKIPFLDLIHPDDVGPTSKELEEKLKAGHSAIGFVNRYRHKDGSYRWLEWITMPVLDKGMLYAVARDITERRKSEEALVRSEEKYRELIETTDDFVTQVDGNGKFIFVNHMSRQILGLKPDECIGKSAFDFIHVDDRAKTVKIFVDLIANKEKMGEFENRQVSINGNVRDMLWTSNIHYDASGEVISVSGMGRDITERKQVEDALRESEAKYKYLVETSQNLIWECNAEGRFTYLNPEWESVLGYKLDEMLGRSFGEFQPPEISARDLKEFSRHLAGGAVKGYETVYIASSGELKNLLFNAIPMFDHEGNIAGTQGTATDITKLKQGEIELKNTANQLRTNIDRMPIGYILWDENFKALEWNQAAEKIFGYTKKEMIGKRPVEFIVLKEVRPFVNEVIKRLLSGEDKVSYSEDGNNITKDGRIISCMWHNATFVDTDGNTTAVLSMVQDITERKKEQDNLSQSLKDKEILLREVHHRVKNNLSVIMALLQLQANNADDNKIISMLEDTRSRIMSMSLVHEKLYQSEGISTIDLDDYISTLISRIFVSLGISQEKIKYDLSISRIDLNLDVLIPLGMILNELITNSIKHAFKGDSGSISISLSASGEQKTLTYYDSGVGLPESFEINKITTLGLKIVSTLTKQLKGELDITSAPGARFTIKFIKE